MYLESGATDRIIYFIAVQNADLRTRLTGLNNFTVYRSRNGSANTQYVTPTITELDAVNSPGIYTLLIDEDTTLAAGHQSEEYMVDIQHAGMATVTRVIDLYSPIFPTGAVEFTYTMTESGSGDPIEGVEVWFSTDNPTGSPNDVSNVVWRGFTDAFGVARDASLNLPLLDSGTYYVWRQLGGYTFANPDTEIVSP